MNNVVYLGTYRALYESEAEDELQNKLWDRFQWLAEKAHTWRDHETIDELIGIIELLRPRIYIKACNK